MSLENLLKNTRRIALAGGILSTFFLGSCSLNKEANKFEALSMSTRKMRESRSENLRLNRNSGVSIVSYKNLDKAMKDVAEMNEKTSMEEAFLGLKDGGKWKWYEIGKNSSSQEVEIKTDYLIEKLRQNQESEKVYLVHNHSKSPYNYEKYPSKADLGYLYNVQNLLERKMPDAQVKGLIHSGNYITKYSFSEKGMKNLCAETFLDSGKTLENKNGIGFREYVKDLSENNYLDLEFSPYQSN